MVLTFWALIPFPRRTFSSVQNKLAYTLAMGPTIRWYGGVLKLYHIFWSALFWGPDDSLETWQHIDQWLAFQTTANNCSINLRSRIPGSDSSCKRSCMVALSTTGPESHRTNAVRYDYILRRPGCHLLCPKTWNSTLEQSISPYNTTRCVTRLQSRLPTA
jgi:hypothetical protein